MNSPFTSYHQEKEFLKEAFESTEHYLEVNKVLDKYGWNFINPYIQVFKLNHILNQEKQGLLSQEKVDSFFIKEFYDLSNTLSFIDGYFNRSKFISSYNYFIEHSLILCFQKDYAGAINLLIPVIEGTLGSYIKDYRGTSLKEGNRYEKIKKSIKQIKEDILLNIKSGYESSSYDKNQINHLISFHRKYYDNWTLIINTFLEKSLFAHTDINLPDNNLNRHLILHFIDIKKYHSLGNYIKLFNCLKFLVWLFLTLERKSILNNIQNQIFLEKRLLYEELIKQSEKLTPIKHAILKEYDLNNKSDLSHNPTYELFNKDLSTGGKIYLYIQKKMLFFRSKIELKNNPTSK